jgi:hypothetical protein
MKLSKCLGLLQRTHFCGQASVLSQNGHIMAGLDVLLQVIDGLVAEYDVSATGSLKWQKLVTFLQKRYRSRKIALYESCFCAELPVIF